jgi:hypothetical protein
MLSWFKHLWHGRRPSRGTTPPVPFRPTLEGLEDRSLPSALGLHHAHLLRHHHAAAKTASTVTAADTTSTSTTGSTSTTSTTGSTTSSTSTDPCASQSTTTSSTSTTS